MPKRHAGHLTIPCARPQTRDAGLPFAVARGGRASESAGKACEGAPPQVAEAGGPGPGACLGDRGQADALVKGFAYATAPIVGYLNSDDYLLPGALQLVLEHFERQPEVDAWYSHRIFVDEFDHLLRYWYLPPHSNYINLRWDFIPQETCFWRRTAMEAVGGIDRRLDFAMDYDLFVRMMRAGCRFRRLDDFLAVFREHDASKTVCHMETVGAREVNVVQQANRVSIHWYDRLVAAAFYSWLQLRSARLKRRLPLGPDAFIRRKA